MILLAQNRDCASQRATCPISRSRFSSDRMAMASLAMVFTSPTSARNPVLPCSITSGTPPTAVPTAGTSQAMASRAARPKDSISLGTSIRSAIESFSLTRSTLPRNSTFLRSPFLLTSHSARERSGPSPMQQPRWNPLLHPVENLDDVANALHGPEIGNVDQDALVGS